MRQKQRYKRGRQKTSFKPASQALINAVSQIRQQSKTEIGALKDLQIQQRNIDDQEISHVSNNSAFQQESQKSVFRLNDASRNLIQENSRIRADRDVENLLGVAKEYEKKANHLAQLAPKQAKMYSDLVTGIFKFSEAVRYHKAVKERDENENIEWQHSNDTLARLDVQKKLLASRIKNWDESFQTTKDLKQDPSYKNLVANGLIPTEDYKIVHDDTFGSNVEAFGKKAINKFKAEKESILKSMEAFFSRTGTTISRLTADDLYEWYSHEYLRQINVKPNSRAGKWIRDQFQVQATLKKEWLTNLDNSDHTAAMMHDYSSNLSNSMGNGESSNDQINFNQGVYAVLTGTFYNEKKGTFTFGSTDLKRAAVDFTKYHVTKNRGDYGNHQDIIDHISPLVVLDKDTVDSFSKLSEDDISKAVKLGKPLFERHPREIDTILESWDASQKIGAQERLDAKRAEDSKNIADSESRYQEHLKNKKNGFKIENINGEDQKIPYEMTNEQFWYNEIDIAHDLGTGTNASKEAIYRKASDSIQFKPYQWSAAKLLSSIKLKELNGDHEGALKDYLSASPSVQDKIRPHMENYNTIYNSGWSFGPTATKGIKGINQRAEFTLKKGEKANKGNKTLSLSGQGMVVEMTRRVEEKAASITADKNYKGTDKQAIELAWIEEDEEFEKGINLSQPDEYGEGFYARKREQYTDGTDTLAWYVYKNNDMSSVDSDYRTILLDLRARTADGTLKKATEEIQSLKVNEYEPETVRLVAKHGNRTYEDWLKDDSVISPDNVKELADKAAYIADRKPGFSFVTFEVPENIKIICHLTGKTEVEFINDKLKEQGHEVAFADDGSDAGRIRNDGELVRDPNSLYGITLARSAMAQNIIPMQGWVRASIEGGLSVSEAFYQSIDIGTYTDFEGNTKLTDYTKFFKENGVSKDPTFDWKGEFGLTGVTYKKKLRYQKDQLEKELLRRKAQSKPIK